ncbi:sensor histidine kinase [Clostridium sp. CF012]|uniref:sensor histidine kinase n=1 Tax=Clostridium sp. CF012 TaxID=2843319 RepID=UPI001C0CD0EB|nr:sensor histidine kinase [Clostridium sp. CF012]MBU3144245.1 histidine kinase [Clostridium sp. CF012]
MNIIRKLATRVHKRFLKFKIRTKINTIYLVILLFSLSISYVLYNAINNRIVENNISRTSLQTLNALDKNLEFILGNVSQFSNLIFFDKGVQDALRRSKSEGIEYNIQSILNKYLANMLLSGEYISSVYVFDNYDNKYSMGKYVLKPMVVDKIENAPWYNEIINLQGDMKWIVNAGGALATDPNHNYISLIRVINDINTMKKLATLIVNVDEDTIQKSFEDIGNKYKSQFFIMDEKGQYITTPPIEDKSFEKELIPKLVEKQGYTVEKLGDSKNIICFTTSKFSNWKIVGIMPISELSKDISTMRIISIIILIVNSLFISLGAVYITKLVTRPLIKMQHYMGKAQQGDFTTMVIDIDREDEIVQLKRGFNTMIIEIEELINKVKLEQIVIRKNELNLIRAQVNPHFLYNTLDAISALSLLKDNESAFKITQSLGEFYRISLSSGKEIIRVEEEINCIKNYLTILDIRYKGKFSVTYEIEEEMYNLKILKLILQPFVENAIHHGLRNKHGKGKLEIKAYIEEGMLVFIVKDDGIGMSSDKILEILSRRSQVNKNGFGIYSSVQRISIFYNVENPLSITSVINERTEITIKVPMVEEETNGDY